MILGTEIRLGWINAELELGKRNEGTLKTVRRLLSFNISCTRSHWMSFKKRSNGGGLVSHSTALVNGQGCTKCPVWTQSTYSGSMEMSLWSGAFREKEKKNPVKWSNLETASLHGHTWAIVCCYFSLVEQCSFYFRI